MLGGSLVPAYLLISCLLMLSFYFMFQKKLGKGFFFTGSSTCIWSILSIGIAAVIASYSVSPLPSQQAMGASIACITLCASSCCVWCT